MQYGQLPGINKRISRLVQGVMPLVQKDAAESFALLDRIYEQGCTTFDTAHGYSIHERGDVDRTLGTWINARGLQDTVVILGKGAHPYEGQKRVTPEHITSDLHESLERMQLDHIDLYILHRDDPDVPVGPIVEILNEHHKAGKISAFGGSNWTVPRIEEANAYAAEHGLKPFVASSIQYSLAEMVKEAWPACLSIGGPNQQSAWEWYRQTQMAVFNWSSLAGGFFSGRFQRDNLDTFDEYFDQICIQAYCYEDNFRRLDRAAQLAREKGASLAQVALAYVLIQPLNIFPLVGCRTAEEFAANVAAFDLHLTPEEQAWLDLRRETLNGH